MEKKEDKPEEDPLESLEPIRQSIRRICSQDQFTWGQSWTSVLSDVNQVRRGLLLPDVFQQTLELNEIRLTKKAFQALVEQFQLPNGAVQAHKFLQWIDLSRPNDHIDPELAFARLPQPYRRILKVLEHDILDAAWEKIRSTSAKFKAETSAALSARSARASLLSLQPNDDAAGSIDDYDLAKKRVCKAFKELPSPQTDSSPTEIVMMTKHWKLPFLLVAWKCESAAEATGCLLLQLVDTQTQTTLALQPVLPPTPTTDSTAASTNDVELVAMTQLCCRENELAGEDRVLVVALHICITPKPVEDTAESSNAPPVSSVVVYEFTVPPKADRSPSGRVVSSTVYDDPSSLSVTALEISNDALFLAVATAKSETLVYTLPPALDSSSKTLESTPPQQQPQLLATMLTESPTTAVYFLAAPTTDFRQQTGAKPYAIALVAGHSLSKFLLPTATTRSAARLHASWSHLSLITSSCIDPTSRFLTLGLEDGLVVVWNVLEDRDHAMLSTSNATIDQVVFHGDSIVVGLSLASQQLFFYNISHRAAPRLTRVVTPPPLPSQQQNETGDAAEPTRFLAISSQTAWLDVPVVLVEFSNGCCMLYDAHIGEAISSFRIPKTEKTRASTSLSRFTSLGNGGVVAAVPASGSQKSSSPLVVFDWAELLKTAFPALETALESQSFEKTTTNLKRMFVASSDDSRDGMAISLGTKASLHSLLLSSAGHHTVKSSVQGGGFQQLQGLAASKSSSTLSKASNSDSRTSLMTSTGSLGGGGPPVQPTTPQLPVLSEVLMLPLVPSISARFERYCDEENFLVARSDRDAKLQRRRNELIKILTAAW